MDEEKIYTQADMDQRIGEVRAEYDRRLRIQEVGQRSYSAITVVPVIDVQYKPHGIYLLVGGGR